MYTLVYKDWNPDKTLTRTELYQWISILIMVSGMIYHLWTALTHNPGHRLKNPNELYSFSALFIINNCIFIAKLIYNAIKIKHDWIDKTFPYETPSNIDTLNLAVFILTFVCLGGSVITLSLMSAIVWPLR